MLSRPEPVYVLVVMMHGSKYPMRKRRRRKYVACRAASIT